MDPTPRPVPEELLAHAVWLRSLARNLVRDAHLAEDLVQDTWLTAMKLPPADDQARGLRRWLAAVLRNRARSELRARRRRAERERAAAAPEHGRWPAALRISVRLATTQYNGGLRDRCTRWPFDAADGS